MGLARIMAAVAAAALIWGCAGSQRSEDRAADQAGEIAVTGAPPPPSPPPPAPYPRSQMRVMGLSGGAAKMAAPSAGYYFGPTLAPRMRGADTEKYPDAKANPVKSVKAEPVSTFSIDVDTASYSNARRYLNDGELPPRDAVRVEEMINYFDYDYPLPKSQTRPFEPSVALAPSPWNPGKTLLHIGIQGYDIRPAARPPLNLTLLIDVSGSMQPDDRLPLAKKIFRQLTDDLGPKDRVSIVVYASATGAVLEPTSDKAKMLSALDRLSAGGSTAGGEGLALAYALAERNFSKSAINRVIIATDGDFNVGIVDPARLEDFVAQKRASGIYLSVLGFGRGNYNDALMQKIAQAGNGAAAYIDTLAEGRKVLHDQMQSALLPIADDVKLQLEFNPARVAEYRLIGYETRLLNQEDFSNDRVDAGDIGAGANVTAIYELTPAGGKTAIDPLRYQSASPPPGDKTGEIAFLRIRYKPPGAKDSILIERAITSTDAYASLAAAPEATRFATAVAGFGQLLAGDTHLARQYGYDDVIALANAAKGADPFGWRAEFVQLARAAKTAAPLPEPEPLTEAPERRPPRGYIPLKPRTN
ncbi:MAG: von Willebrand factor type A domain-containing protein [Hyphomonadaceae bacterium]